MARVCGVHGGALASRRVGSPRTRPQPPTSHPLLPPPGPTVAAPAAAALVASIAIAAALAARHAAHLPSATLAAAAGAALALAAAAARAAGAFPFHRTVWIREFAAWRPPADWYMTSTELVAKIRTSGYFSEGAADLMEKVIGTSGLGEATALSPGILKMQHGECVECGVGWGSGG